MRRILPKPESTLSGQPQSAPVAQHQWVLDLLEGGGADKKSTTAGDQPVGEAEYLIARFTEPDALIVDPYAGAGTVGVAYINTGRRYVGTEIDPGDAAIAPGGVARRRGSWLTQAVSGFR